MRGAGDSGVWLMVVSLCHVCCSLCFPYEIETIFRERKLMEIESNKNEVKGSGWVGIRDGVLGIFVEMWHIKHIFFSIIFRGQGSKKCI